MAERDKFTLSAVNPAWGGPFKWVTNEAGQLTLQKLEKLPPMVSVGPLTLDP